MHLGKLFAMPIVWSLTLMVAGLVLMRSRDGRRRSKAGWWSVLVAAMVLVVFSLSPVANLLTYSLESRYEPPTPEALATLDLVVVLGGGVRPSGPLRPEPELGRETFLRVYHGVRYFQKSGADAIAFCGGPPWPEAESEAETMRTMALAMGVPVDRTMVETGSSNTMMNAAGLAELLPAGTGRRIGLVTSATHMMRSKWVFERVFPNDTTVPLPVYFTYDRPRWALQTIVPLAANLDKSTMALHEWIGILWYALRY